MLSSLNKDIIIIIIIITVWKGSVVKRPWRP